MTNALLIAHGAPSDPAPQEAAMAALALAVGTRLPDWQVRSATLATPGGLAAALAGLDRPLIYPFFMAEGYFTRTLLPQRLRDSGGTALRQLPAFGHSPGLPALVARAALDGTMAAGLAPQSTTLILAAHGSQVSRASATGARAMAGLLARMAPFARVVTGFVEEHPLIQTVATNAYPAVCLPFFALRASHVAQDVPEALARAGFRGALLPAIGEHAGAAAVIAADLRIAAAAAK